MKKQPRRYILEQDTMFDYNDRTKKEAARTRKLARDKKKTGICLDELWSLDYSIAVFLVPRLELFIKHTIGYPCNFQNLAEWKKVLRKILYAMKLIKKQDIPWDEKADPKFYEGIKLFGEYFLALWY